MPCWEKKTSIKVKYLKTFEQFVFNFFKLVKYLFLLPFIVRMCSCMYRTAVIDLTNKYSVDF